MGIWTRTIGYARLPSSSSPAIGSHLYRFSGRRRRILTARLTAAMETASIRSITDMIKHAAMATRSSGAIVFARSDRSMCPTCSGNRLHAPRSRRARSLEIFVPRDPSKRALRTTVRKETLPPPPPPEEEAAAPPAPLVPIPLLPLLFLSLTSFEERGRRAGREKRGRALLRRVLRFYAYIKHFPRTEGRTFPRLSFEF